MSGGFCAAPPGATEMSRAIAWSAARRGLSVSPMCKARHRRFYSSESTSDVVVVGAGIVGVTTAHYLAVKHKMSVTLIDPRPPLSYTSSMSTECYRDFFPSVGMHARHGLHVRVNIGLSVCMMSYEAQCTRACLQATSMP